MRLCGHHPCCRVRRCAAADAANADGVAERQSVRDDAKRRHGLGRRQKLTGKEVADYRRSGGIRAGDGRPGGAGLPHHTGKFWPPVMQAGGQGDTRNGGIPFAAFVSTKSDGRSGTQRVCLTSCCTANDAAIVRLRLIRLPTRCRAVIGVATHDKACRRP